MNIGERIKARREYLNITQEELAHKVGYKSRKGMGRQGCGRNVFYIYSLVDILYHVKIRKEGAICPLYGLYCVYPPISLNAISRSFCVENVLLTYWYTA